MRIAAVIFDLDGTLVDSNAAHVEAWRRAFARYGYDIPADRIRPEIGKGGDQLLPDVIGEEAAGKDGDALREANGEEFKEIAGNQRFAVFPGAEALIRQLRDRGVRTALATSSKPEHMKPSFRACGVDFTELVDETASAADAESSKPAPDLVHAAVARLGLPAADCVMVGDTVYDGQAAGKAGVAFWGLTCGGCASEADLRGAGAAGVWRDPADLLAHLDQLLGPAKPA